MMETLKKKMMDISLNLKEYAKQHLIKEKQHPESKTKKNEDWKKGFVGKHAKFNPV